MSKRYIVLYFDNSYTTNPEKTEYFTNISAAKQAAKNWAHDHPGYRAEAAQVHCEYKMQDVMEINYDIV